MLGRVELSCWEAWSACAAVGCAGRYSVRFGVAEEKDVVADEEGWGSWVK